MHLRTIGLQAILVHGLQNSSASSGGHRVAAVSVEMDPARQRLGDLWRCYHRRERQPVADALRMCNPFMSDACRNDVNTMQARTSDT